MHTTGMSKIGNVNADSFSLVQAKEKQMTTHDAWYGDISASEAEQLLKDKPCLTYLLRQGENKYSFFISFIQQDGSIKHQVFFLELDHIGWLYRNFCGEHCSKENFDILIPLMMHCESHECIPLIKAT